MDPSDKHVACHTEFDRRRTGGLCVKCGKAITETGIAPYYHDSCLKTGDEGFLNYPDQ